MKFLSTLILLACASCASVQKPTIVQAIDSDALHYNYCAKVVATVSGVTNYSLACDTVPGVFLKHQEAK